MIGLVKSSARKPILAAVILVLLHQAAAPASIPARGAEAGASGRIADKTLVAWVQLADRAQRGGGALTIQTPAEEFDGVVFGELAPGKWMAGSDLFRRTQADQAANPDEVADPRALVQVAISYAGKRITIHRDGRLYAQYESGAAEPLVFDESSIVVMGLRHLAAPEPHSFLGAIEEARLYDVALDGPALAALRPGEAGSPPPLAQWTFEDGKAEDRMGRFRFTELRGGARVVDGKLRLDKPGDCLVARREKPWRDGPRSFIHYRPESGKVGDVIPFHWKGQHHVFYLNESRWDHIVSTDLINWKELPPALIKGDDPLGPDGEACWTGSVVEHDGTFHLFYTGKNIRDPAGDQKVMAATSKDLIHWEKTPARTFYADGGHYWSKPHNGVADGIIYHHQAFRDPDVFFHEGERKWWMLLHALTVEGRRPCIGLYTSPDLQAWTPRAPIATYEQGLSLDCPHAAPVGGKWFIIAADASYTSAPSPDGPYSPGMTPYDVGDLFVPKSLFDGKRRILWGWVRDLEGGKDRGKPLWGGTMSMAREMVPDEQGRLGTRPPAEVTAAFARTALDLADQPPLRDVTGDWRYDGSVLASGGGDGSCRLDAPGDFLLDCTLLLDPGAEFTLTLRQQGASEAGYPLTLRPKRGQVEVRRGESHFALPAEFDSARPISLQVFVQDSIIECFVDGRHALTSRAYDYRQGKLGLGVTGGKAKVLGLKIKTRAQSN
ncbi:MAG: glycoside hydrolase family 32 protein [Paludisphaera borealis]|uniref:glycoside hydrolase family 32 protein n=1 Tax=Paludisphaera borealis TaxID=1387353 RepID=UPI00284852ED|nr:glycoside hydrolase family 32 protein [Paludisphaera borealis]MDR3621221.1 glycoside hydrolase family 32 protein [Paludisphaera borealis]